MAAFSESDHRRVTEAVARAERGTDGEIVTIVSARSDGYHDVALHYAVLAMLLVPALGFVWPGLLGGGWGEPTLGRTLALVLALQAVIFLVVRYALEWRPLRMTLTPGATRTRRVRRRAVALFKASTERRTAARVGVLLYLSIEEHRAEIVADAAIVAQVTPETWGEAMVALVDGVRGGDPAGGMAAAVAQVGRVLERHFPKTGGNPNEISDRLIEL